MIPGPINPLAPAVAGAGYAQEAQARGKAGEVQRQQRRRRVGAEEDALLERPIENPDAIVDIGQDDHQRRPPRDRHGHPRHSPESDEDSPPSIDLTA